ncbi:MAG: cell wall-binding repeat-containing protein, partial [Actinomycetia bacterium]|nr:cell wall-binding repeat-containing protein [Actinomycetes bacterium]
MRIASALRKGFALVLVSALLVPGMTIVPAYAAGTYTGGASEAPLFVPNDHTAVGIRFSASAGLEATTTYYVKVRFTAADTPDPSTNRGWTWNPATHEWVQEREAWTNFPTVTTDASGAIGDTWLYAKFGDDDTTGTYKVMVSLSKTGASSTFNPSSLPEVTVIDMKSHGGWVHNATTTGQTNKRVECTSWETSLSVYSLSQTEPNLVDDDGNGVVDDEDYGPAGVSGDFRLGVSADTTMDVAVKRTFTPPYYNDFILPAPDTEVALNAADMLPPSSVSSLAAEATETSITLSWEPATDEGSGVTAYKVLRWIASPSDAYTMPHEIIGTVAAPATTFVDNDAAPDTEYDYEVRAVDASGNVGPRSNMASATLKGLGETTRTAGTDRYATAIAISSANFAPSSVTTAVIATGRDFPDALAASGLAGVYGSPVLLVGTTVTEQLRTELDRLGVEAVVLVGGTTAIPNTVADALAVDYDVSRLYGQNRYETAAEVAYAIEEATGVWGSAFFVRGDQFADALAVAPFAWSQAMPVLLVQTGAVPGATSMAIDDLGITGGVVAGGTSAVSAATFTTLDGMLTGTLERVNGADRYATARAVADWGVTNSMADYSYVGIATGLGFADALGGGAAAGSKGGVLLLTAPASLSAPVSSAISANATAIDLVEIYGGPSAVSD